ncbi:MAG: cytochrome b [Castellaniella sp.]|uniref:cytochrome b n=1 Tax=Castellaniella sp. TaxID=1955812 RepID=UPI002A371BFD|nr:cytochrome b [Castellaniella sp.]MDY0310377.1 cytochrome b [Castellaniella sp.]
MPAPARYNRLSISLHWLTLLLIVVVYAAMELKGLFPKESSEHALMKMLHSSCGLTILALTVIRLATRLTQGRPAITPEPAAWERASALLMHVALYAFLIAMPLLAWFGINAVGGTVKVWGIALPALTGEDKALGKTIIDTHKLIANIGYALIGLHALAALRHHYISRDDTLRRMLPART